MGKYEKLYEIILMRRSDANIPFDSLRILLKRLGFEERIKGDHHIFIRDDIEEILNIQSREGKGKPYQVNKSGILSLNIKFNSGNNYG